MKTLVFFVLVGVALAADLTPEQLDLLANVEYEELPQDMKDDIRSEKVQKRQADVATGGKDNSHWCCANDQPVNTIQRSRTKMQLIKAQEKVKIGYTQCGFLGSTRCSLYELRYRQETKYYIDYYEVPNQDACPDKHVKCCNGYVLIAQDNCLSLDLAKKHIDTLEKLKKAGLIGTGNGFTL